MAMACSTAFPGIFACLGGFNDGADFDLAGRKQTKEGVGKMYYFAELEGDVESLIANAQSKAAGRVLVIDGDNLDCARKNPQRVKIAPVAFTGAAPFTNAA